MLLAAALKQPFWIGKVAAINADLLRSKVHAAPKKKGPPALREGVVNVLVITFFKRKIVLPKNFY